MDFVIYRNGSNAANQSMCDRLAIDIIEADSADEARTQAESRHTFYANQSCEAVLASEADISDDEWDSLNELVGKHDDLDDIAAAHF